LDIETDASLTFTDHNDYDIIEEHDRISLVKLNDLKPGSPVKAVIKKADGSIQDLMLNHTLTEEQIQWFRAGSALNVIRNKEV
jgi:aconitate hydratase